MSQEIEAIWDGEAFRPVTELELEPNTRVRLIVEKPRKPKGGGKSFLDTARGISIQGPHDWATNLDDYLYHGCDLPHIVTKSGD